MHGQNDNNENEYEEESVYIPQDNSLPFNNINISKRTIVFYPAKHNPHAKQGKSKKGAIISLILGIVSVILGGPISFLKLPVISVFAIIVGIAALKLGEENKTENKCATIGATLGIIGLLFGIVTAVMLFMFY